MVWWIQICSTHCERSASHPKQSKRCYETHNRKTTTANYLRSVLLSEQCWWEKFISCSTQNQNQTQISQFWSSVVRNISVRSCDTRRTTTKHKETEIFDWNKQRNTSIQFDIDFNLRRIWFALHQLCNSFWHLFVDSIFANDDSGASVWSGI